MTETPRARMRSLDGLRGWAAVVVLIHHLLLMGSWFSTAQSATSGVQGGDALHRAIFYSPLHIFAAGSEAVALFFVLSGAVLAIAFPGRETLGVAYQVSRLVRLYLPIFGAVLIALTLSSLRPDVPTAFLSSWHAEHLTALQWSGALSHPASLIRELTVLGGTSWLDAPLWSMRVEIAISIGFFAIWMLARLGWLGFVLSVVAAVALRHSPVSWLVLNLPYFVLGALIIRSHWRCTARQGSMLYLLGVFLFTAPWMVRGVGFDVAFGLLGTAWSVLGAACFVIAARSESPLTSVLEGKLGTYLGQRSYSLYLIHAPVVTTAGFWLAMVSHGEPNWWVWRIPCALLAFGTAEIFYHFVEKPAHRFSRQLRGRLKPAASHG